MSAITAKASRKMKKYAVLTREPRCFLGSFDFSWEQRKFSDITFPAGEKNKDNLPLESYSITNEHGFVPQDEKFENGGTMREADKRMYYIVSPNSFAYNPARINVGSIGYQNIGKNVIVSSLYEVFKTSEDVDDRLLWHWFKSSDFQKLIMQLQEGGVRLYFYYDKLCMGEVSLPSLDEQRKIGKLFDTLDNLITLHQRKCVFLFGFFQAFISMIFTASTFSWEQRKLGDVVKEITRNDPESEAPIMMITANNGFIEQSERYAFNNAGESLKKYILLKKGELAYNHGASKLRPYGSCFALTTAENARIPFVYHCFSAENQNAEFMSIELNGAEIENQLRKIVSSGARMDGLLNISFDEYTSVSVILPGTEEQDRIAYFFRHLDNLITLHQRECISFTTRAGRLILTANKKRNTSSWEQRKLGDVVKEITRNDPESEAPIMMITANNGFIEQSERYAFNNAGESLKKYILLKKGELAYNHGASKLRPYGSCFALTTAENARIPFVYHCFSAENQNAEFMSIELNGAEIENQLRKIVSSGARMDGLLNISFDEYTSVSVILPGTEEQDRIAYFFRHLDNLITLHQRKPFLMKWRTSDANRNQTNRLVL